MTKRWPFLVSTLVTLGIVTAGCGGSEVDPAPPADNNPGGDQEQVPLNEFDQEEGPGVPDSQQDGEDPGYDDREGDEM